MTRKYKGASLEFEKLPMKGFVTSITVGAKYFELEPPIEIEAGQRLADIISVEVRLSESPVESAGSTVVSQL